AAAPIVAAATAAATIAGCSFIVRPRLPELPRTIGRLACVDRFLLLAGGRLDVVSDRPARGTYGNRFAHRSGRFDCIEVETLSFRDGYADRIEIRRSVVCRYCRTDQRRM